MNNTIKLNGESVPFRFTNYELAQYQDERDLGFDDFINLGKKLKLMDIYCIAKLGLNRGLKDNGLAPIHTIESIAETVGLDETNLANVMEGFTKDSENFTKGQVKPPKTQKKTNV